MRDRQRGASRGLRLRGIGLLLAVGVGVAGIAGVANASLSAPAQSSCSAPAWTIGEFYDQGTVVSHNGHQWRATSWLWPGVEPGVSGVPPWWVPWQDLGSCAPGTTTTTTTAPASTTTTSTPGSTTTTTQADPGESVEDHFQAAGPWAVTSRSVNVPGSTINPVPIIYPSNLGADGVDHPILVFVTGTGATVSENDSFLSHFASWGYVVAGISSPGVLAPNQPENARAAAEYLVAENGNPSSPFSGHLDADSIGLFGHSQGAGATLQTMGSPANSDGRFSSAVTLALPDRTWWLSGENPNYGQITQPMFFVSGTADFLTSPAEQTFFFNQVAGPAAKAGAVGKDHVGMLDASRGYVTAWFKYALDGDQFARGAFAGGSPELASNPAWTNWAAKSLP